MNDDDPTVLGDGSFEEVPTGSRLGEYRLVRRLGRGAMGEVYEAEQVRLGRRYALKLLPSELNGEAAFRTRFEQEARTLAGLDHPNIVQIVYAGEAAIGERTHAYLVMELLTPLDLVPGQPVAEARARSLLSQMLTALAYAHGKGVVHRDLKPANLLLAGAADDDGANAEDTPRSTAGAGKLKVGDFGVARVVGEDYMRTVVERTVAMSVLGDAPTSVGASTNGSGGYVGTIQYMAPEVVGGGEATERSDLYAVGVMAYEWLTGRKPIGRVKAVSRLRPDLEGDWDEWVDALLEYEPGDRTESAEAALEGLSAVAGTTGRVSVSSEHSPGPKKKKEKNQERKADSVGGASSSHGRVIAGENVILELPGKVRMELAWIEPGEFLMGSPGEIREGGFLGFGGKVVQKGEDGRFVEEGPQTRVRLTRGYWLGQTPVTQGQWEAVMGDNPSYFKGSKLPVERVSWKDAMAFCEKLTERERSAGRLPEGYEYTLPAEAQWEYACRAGTRTRFHSGDLESDLAEVGWYDGNSGGKTHPVGKKRANAWGLYDMHGNVWEWCADWYGGYPGGSVTDPTGPSAGLGRVNRGGSWFSNASSCRSARRSGSSSGNTRYALGFRLALSSVQ